jgi:molecular chaperone HtpG
MSTIISSSSLRRSTPSPWAHLHGEIVVGKDILELLSTSMYVDPLSIYREYVQNAADSIDEARESGLLREEEQGRVEFAFDLATRTARIRDNGTGVSPSDFVRRLTSFGASTKRGRGSRGFRGVGRLAGLGYCQELVFRTKAPGEKMVSELRWDCRKLKAALRSGEQNGHLQDLVSEIVATREVDGSGFPERFFEVELQGVVRHRNDQLLDPVSVGSYLSQVAPLPFLPDFKFGKVIRETLNQHVKMGDLVVRLVNFEEQVYRPHRDSLDLGNGNLDEFKDVEFIQVPGVDGGLAAIGWVLHHGYTGALPAGALVKGIRLRAGNVQVGDDRLLEELFAEARFNSWAVGEIHVIDRRLLPNGRRDHFEQNVHYNNLLTHLTPVARELSRRCRTSSIRRNRWREFMRFIEVAREKLSIIRQGTLSRAEQIRYLRDVHASVAEAEKLLASEKFETQNGTSPDRELQRLRREVAKVEEAERSSVALSHLPKAQRRTYEQVFALLYECAPNRTVAKAIIDRMLTRM